jgi:hypothetical protein
MPSNDHDLGDERRPDRFGDRPQPIRRLYDEEPQTKSVSVLGVLALISGIGSMLFSFIPCCGMFAIVGGVPSLLLGGVAWILANNSNGRTGIGVPIASVIVSVISILFSFLWWALVYTHKPVLPAIDDGSPAIVVRVKDLEKEFDENELAADTKYKNKIVEVAGEVLSISRNDKPGKITVELVDAGQTVECHFSNWGKANVAELGQLQVGQGVRIRGICQGKVDGIVTVDSCSLVKGDAKPEPIRTDPKKNEPKKNDPGSTPPIFITAADFDKAYAENAVKADTNYKGRHLEVTGKFIRVSRVVFGIAVVELEGHDGDTVNFHFNEGDQAPLAKLVPGDMVVIRGICQHEGTISIINCIYVKTLQKPSLGPPVVVSAVALAKAYEGNSVAADTKYKGKYLEITGPVLRVSQQPPGRITVEIGDEDRFLLRCDFAAKDNAQFEKVNVGDKVTIRGVCRGNAFGTVTLEDCTIPKKDEKK